MTAIDWRKLWQFLDYSGDQFATVQSESLRAQFAEMSANPVMSSLSASGTDFTSVDDFRARVRLSTWDDYADHLNPKSPAATKSTASNGSKTWVYTQFGAGRSKWVPYTRPALDRLADSVLASIGLAASTNGKTSNIERGDRALFNIPPRPYLAGYAAFELVKKYELKPLIPLEPSEDMEFKQRIAAGFAHALNDRVDILISMTSVLKRVAERFDPDATRSGGSSGLIKKVNARGAFRLAGAKLKSTFTNHTMKPRDLWEPKCVVGWGLDTRFYSDEIEDAWGRPPYEMFASTEAGVMGTQFRDGGGMGLDPHTCFYEFISESELELERADPNYMPRTCLLDEVESGETYEVVITSFFGMPFVRYRLGHIVRFTSDHVGYGHEFLLVGRSDERIDIGGFTRIDEATVWKAITQAGLPIREWTVRREIEGIVPELHMYLELSSPYEAARLVPTLHQSLKDCDPLYSDLEKMLGICPLKVSVLSPGTFDTYIDMQLKQGSSFVGSRPTRMNASDEVVGRLVALDRALALSA
ncbi:MAG: GH3 auxin-responsive promoter family protein [Chloroflexi bacterium]|nr:GH3 auxin-responsive promoter family protein [Chloroflexota bacterium]